METVAQRTKQLRDVLGVSQQALGNMAGVSKAAVSNWELGKCEPDRDSLLSLKRKKRVNPDWLAYGKGEMFLNGAAASQPSASTLLPGPPLRGRVPVISWTSAGQWEVIVDNNEPGTADEWVETTVPIRQHTFALKVQGDSMEPIFPNGCYIVIEPEMQAESGNYVIARQNGDEATFKQLVRDGGKTYLKPLNPRYPIMELGVDAEIVGVVRAMHQQFV